MEKILAGALITVGFGLLLIAGLIAMVVLRRWAASRDDETAGRLSEIEKAIDRLKSEHKLLRGEWADRESRLDTLVRRGVRLGVLERKNGEGAEAPAPPAPAALTRAEVLRAYRERQGK